MGDRAWPDGPTWEETVRRVIAQEASRRRSRRASKSALPLWATISRITSYGSTYSVQLCRTCGFDATTGWWIEEER